MGRLFWSLVLVAVGVLGQIPPANHALWYASLIATEWGHWLILPILLIWWPGWQATGIGRLAVLLSIVAAVLVLSPLWKARAYAKVIQAEISKFAGTTPIPSSLEVPARPAPLVYEDLIKGLPVPSIEWRSQPYVKRGDRELEMDVYTPPAGAPTIGGRTARPVVVVFHGGVAGGPWQSGDRQESVRLNQYLAARGYVVVSVDYRLATEAPHPAALNDALAALSAVKTIGTTGGLDPSRIVLLGRGGGAHLALLTAYASGDSSIRGVIGLYPPTDLVAWARNSGKPAAPGGQTWTRAYLGTDLEAKSMALYEAASPRTYAAGAPPTLLVHGGRDPMVPPSQSDLLAASLRQFQRPVQHFQLPWATYSCDINFHGPCGQATTFVIERFLARAVL